MKIRHLNILPPTLLLALSALLSRLLGIFRDHLLAKTFGATVGMGIYDLDVYYAAFRIPDLIYNLLVLGTVSAALIPIFTQYKKQQDMENAWQFASSMLHLMFLGILVVSGVIYILAPMMVPFVAGGFDAEQLALTVKLMRIMLLSPILFSIASVLISIQDSFKTFFYRSLAPLFYNLGIIAGILYFSTEFGVIGVTWGVVIGVALQLLVQLPVLKQLRYKHYWMLGRRRTDVRKALKLIVPRIVGLSMNQLTLIVNTLIASFLVTGSITIFYLADNLNSLPLGMIGIAFAITSFATLSELAMEPTKQPFAEELKRVMGQILFLIIPATIGMLVLRHEIIDVILVYGKFTPADGLLLAQVLGFLLISLFAQSLIPLLARGFYAFQNTKTPVVAGVLGAAVSIVGSLVLALHLEMGIVGIALAFSAGSILNVALLYGWMSKKLKHDILDWVSVLKMVLISLIMGKLVFITKEFLTFGGTTVMEVVQLAVYTIIGLVVYFGLAKLTKLKEFDLIWKQIRRIK